MTIKRNISTKSEGKWSQQCQSKSPNSKQMVIYEMSWIAKTLRTDYFLV